MNLFSLDVPGSGEVSTAESEDMGNEGLGSAARRSSWFDLHIFRRTSGMIVQAIESMISYKNFLPSARVIRGNDPLETTLR